MEVSSPVSGSVKPEGLSLVFNNSNSHVSNFLCGIGRFDGVQAVGDGKFKRVKGVVRCNNWGCAVCRPLKVKKYFKRADAGKIGNYGGRDGFRSRHETKMFTFTCAGQEYRDSHYPGEA